MADQPDDRTRNVRSVINGVAALLVQSKVEERIDTGAAVKLLTQAKDWLAWTLSLHGLDLSDPWSPRCYLLESDQVGGGDGTYPVSVVLAKLLHGEKRRPFATWLRVHRPHGRVTVQGAYFDTLEEAMTSFERRTSSLGVDTPPEFSAA